MTKIEYYQAMGLFSLAQYHYKKCEEFEVALSQLLNVSNGDHHSDAIYGHETLDRALERMKITVED